MPEEQTQAYLRDVQYRDASKLNARARLHQRYGRHDWFGWLSAQGSWSKGAVCLDVGCGTGAFWKAAADTLPFGLRLELLDLSPGMVKAAVEAARSADRYETVKGEVGDAANLPFESASVDTAMAVHVLYHLAEPDRGVVELRRVLKPGGLALVVLNGENNMRELAELVAPIFGGTGRDPSAAVFGLTQGAVALRRHFASVELVSYPDDLAVTDRQDLIDYVLSMPGRDASDAQARLRDTVDRAFDRGDGVFRISKEIGLLRCVA